MGVDWAGVRHEVKPSRTDDLRLVTEPGPAVGASQCEIQERPICGDSVKARHARRIALDSLEQTRYPFLKVIRVEVHRVGGGSLDDIRETNPEARKLSIVLGTEGVGTAARARSASTRRTRARTGSSNARSSGPVEPSTTLD